MVSDFLLNIYHTFSIFIGFITTLMFPCMVYLFLQKSKPEMANFRWYLLVNALWVYAYTILVVVLQPVPALSNFGIIITGIVKSAPLPLLFSLMEGGYFALTAQVYSTQALFFYRYSLMVNNSFIRKTLQTKLAIPFNIISTLFFGLSMTIPSTLTRVDLREISFNDSLKMDKAYLWILANKRNQTILTFNNTGSPMIFIFDCIGIIFALYAMSTIIYCAVKIRKDYLHIKGPSFCPKTRKLRRIFLYTLTINLFAVLISLLLPVIFCFFIPIILRMQFADDLVIVGFIWSISHPIINFSLTVTYVSPYREAIKQIWNSIESKYFLCFRNWDSKRMDEMQLRFQQSLNSSKIRTTQSSWLDRGMNGNNKFTT